jgi:hypothetical protein
LTVKEKIESEFKGIQHFLHFDDYPKKVDQKKFASEKKLRFHVSIVGPPGYEPGALPLRQIATR